MLLLCYRHTATYDSMAFMHSLCTSLWGLPRLQSDIYQYIILMDSHADMEHII